MRTRELVVVQVNATGNDPARHVALEVAAVSLVSGKSWDFTVPLTHEQLVDADPSTLRRMAITVEDWLTVSIYLVHFSLVESPTWRGGL